MLESGVDSQRKCGPVDRVGSLISSSDASKNVTDVELSASARLLQQIRFYDGELQSMHAGFPRKLNPSTCISCIHRSASAGPAHQFILRDCTVKPLETHQPEKMSVHVETTEGAYGTVTQKFIDNHSKKEYSGHGDLTRNGRNCSTFLFYNHTNSEKTNSTKLKLTYFEYTNNDHCENMINRSETIAEQFKNGSVDKNDGVIDETKDVTYSMEITCETPSHMPMDSFSRALRGYRTMQLEDTMSNSMFDSKNDRFRQITTDDLYRAVLSMKISDHDGIDVPGSYKEYVECGTYKMKYMIPLICTMSIIAILGITSKILVRKAGGEVEIPRFCDQSHFADVMSTHRTGLMNPPAKSYFSLEMDELILDDSMGKEQVYIERMHRAASNQDDLLNPDIIGARSKSDALPPPEKYVVHEFMHEPKSAPLFSTRGRTQVERTRGGETSKSSSSSSLFPYR